MGFMKNPGPEGPYGWFIPFNGQTEGERIPITQEDYMEFLKFNDKREGAEPVPSEDMRRTPNDLMGLINRQGTGMR
jgi:hypothetical protein